MRSVLVAGLVTLLTPAAAFAADIEVMPPEDDDDIAIISIDGEITSGDAEVFRKVAAQYANAAILLNSDGGMISPAMEIGRTIKLMNYSTVVSSTGSCASACALIWLAGAERMIFEGGEVGFHAAYLDTDGTKLETGVGNALVGHYLSQMGYGERTVMFATMAPPEKILWLTEDSAFASGIQFESLPSDGSAQTAQGTSHQKKEAPAKSSGIGDAYPSELADGANTRRQPEQPNLMGQAKQTLRSPEAFAKGLNSRGFQAQVNYEDPETPYLSVNVGGEEILVAFSGCSNTGCEYIQLLDWYSDVTKEEARYISANQLSNEAFSHPFWNDALRRYALYQYIVVGSDGITVQTLIDNMNYFVRENTRLNDLIVQRRR